MGGRFRRYAKVTGTMGNLAMKMAGERVPAEDTLRNAVLALIVGFLMIMSFVIGTFDMTTAEHGTVRIAYHGLAPH